MSRLSIVGDLNCFEVASISYLFGKARNTSKIHLLGYGKRAFFCEIS